MHNGKISSVANNHRVKPIKNRRSVLRAGHLISLGVAVCAGLANAGLAASAIVSNAAAPRVFLLDAGQLHTNRLKVLEGDKRLSPAVARLKEDARKALKSGPFSVSTRASPRRVATSTTT